MNSYMQFTKDNMHYLSFHLVLDPQNKKVNLEHIAQRGQNQTDEITEQEYNFSRHCDWYDTGECTLVKDEKSLTQMVHEHQMDFFDLCRIHILFVSLCLEQ